MALRRSWVRIPLGPLALKCSFIEISDKEICGENTPQLNGFITNLESLIIYIVMVGVVSYPSASRESEV
jgi:hypothetical protein